MNIFLCGLPTSGKTLFGRAFAKYLAVPFLDIDDFIVSNYGKGLYCSTSKIFQTFGEETFSSWEVATLRSLTSENGVVALGGGTVMLQETYDIIKGKGILVYLSLSLSIIRERLIKRGLPERLKTAKNLDEVLQQRIDRMQRIADYLFPIDHVDLLNEESLLTACKSLDTLLSK